MKLGPNTCSLSVKVPSFCIRTRIQCCKCVQQLIQSAWPHARDTYYLTTCHTPILPKLVDEGNFHSRNNSQK